MAEGRKGDWERESLVRFLTERLDAVGQTAEADALVLEQGTARQRAFLLLKRGQVGEAIKVARENFGALPGLVIDFANVLVDTGNGDLAAAFIAEQASQSRYGIHYQPWLARYFEEHGDRRAAVDVWRRQFEERPSLDTYQELRRLASVIGTWQSLRSSLLKAVDPERQSWLPLSIALDEDDVLRAIEIVSQPGASFRADLLIRVAKAAESDYPQAALRIYRAQTERAIAARGRANYQVAVGHLLRVRELHGQLGLEAAWETYLNRLREENRRLRALKEELHRAGL
jgi:uncharacterized Zn finger protein